MVKGMIAALLAGAALVPAKAQEPGSQQTRAFVQAAGESDAFEILEAYTALAQSTDPQVVAFARRMIRDHGETSRRLQEATAHAGLRPPPMGMGTDQSLFLAALQSLRGRDFDKAYWQQQALAHRSALVVAQAYAASGDDPAIRSAAAAAIPIVLSHLAMAQHMQANIGGS